VLTARTLAPASSAEPPRAPEGWGRHQGAGLQPRGIRCPGASVLAWPRFGPSVERHGRSDTAIPNRSHSNPARDEDRVRENAASDTRMTRHRHPRRPHRLGYNLSLAILDAGYPPGWQVLAFGLLAALGAGIWAARLKDGRTKCRRSTPYPLSPGRALEGVARSLPGGDCDRSCRPGSCGCRSGQARWEN
jgi:hypothetical protein